MLEALLDDALIIGDDVALRAHLMSGSRLPGPRLNLRLVGQFAAAVGAVAGRPSSPVPALEALLDGWAALGPDVAPGDQSAVILPCAAVAAYGEVGAVRPEWWDDEMGKLRRAALDDRWRVREIVALALQRLLDADWDRACAQLQDWAGDDDVLVVRAAAAGTAEPRLLNRPERIEGATDVQRRAVERLRRVPASARRDKRVRVLRQALGYTVSVVVAASGDFSILDDMGRSGDPDLAWVARQNLNKARLSAGPDGGSSDGPDRGTSP